MCLRTLFFLHGMLDVTHEQLLVLMFVFVLFSTI